MTKTTTTVAVASAIFALAVAASPNLARPPKGHFVPFAMYETTFENGLKLVVIPTESSGMMAMRTLVGTGARDEVEPGHTGFAHFFEHMMFRGTELWPADKRNAALSSLGIDDGGYTTSDFTVYEHTGPSAALHAVIEMEADRFQNLAYTEDVFRTEAKAVLGEYNKTFSDPDNRAEELLYELAYDRHTYKHTALGFLDDIHRMPNEFAYARDFHRRFYTPDNVIIYVGGDVDPIDVQTQVKAHFSTWTGAREKTALTSEAPLKKERRRHIAWPSPTVPRVHVGWRTPAAATDRHAAAMGFLLDTYLFHESSPLYRALVLDDGVLEGMSASAEPRHDAGLFHVVMRVKNVDDNDAALTRLQTALDAIAKGDVDAERFASVRSHVRYAALMELTSAENVVENIAYMSGHAFEPAALDQILVAANAATPDALSRFVRENFGATQRAVVTVAHDEKPISSTTGPKGRTQ